MSRTPGDQIAVVLAEAVSERAMSLPTRRFSSGPRNRVQLLENDIPFGAGAAGMDEGGSEQGGDDGISGDFSHWSLPNSNSVPCCMPPRVGEV